MDDPPKSQKKEDIGSYSSGTIAVLSVIGAIAGVCAVIMIKSLEHFRDNLDAWWMACIPFAFSPITAIHLAFKRKVTALGLHLGLLLTTGAAGASCFGFSIDPVVNYDCVTVYEKGDCEKFPLVIAFLVCGGIACAATVLGLLVAVCACRSGRKTALRRYERIKREEEQAVEARQKAQVEARRIEQAQLAKAKFERKVKSNSAANSTEQKPNNTPNSYINTAYLKDENSLSTTKL